jgi:hypothetical protein
MNSDHRTGSGGGAHASMAAPLDHQPIGGYLKRQRELRGISAEELARTTRIPLRSIERLETGSFDGEVDGFVRGFVRTVAIALGLDPNETVSRMLAEPVPEPVARYGGSDLLPRALAGLAVVVLLVLAIGLVRIASVDDGPVTKGRTDEVVYRLDPVRALAESQAGVSAGAPGAVAAAPPSVAEGTPR